jgi:hypothetical protein
VKESTLAAHPQQDQETPDAVDAAASPPAERPGVKNPFPTQMTVPVRGGDPVTIELAVVEGVVYAPMLDHLPLDPDIKQYVIQYCAAWTSSVLTAGQLENRWPPTAPRRAQIVFRESTLHAMLGLEGDERIMRFDVDQVKGELRVVVESPRLPPMPFWDGGPPIIELPIATNYEQLPL